jgi:iodotyrosine deiodinase
MAGVDIEPGFISLIFEPTPPVEMLEQAKQFNVQMNRRRTTRNFSSQDVPRELIELAIQTASTAPSGAHLQPWTFVAISNAELKAQIRNAAEQEELRTYEERMPEAWSELIQPLGTDHVKEHITTAPWIIVLFRQSKRLRSNGDWGPTYYSQESCGIAAGLLIAAIHNMGLATLTHTPSPMNFLRQLLGRPDHEHAMLLMPVGYPADDAQVPDLRRKTLDEVSSFFD